MNKMNLPRSLTWLAVTVGLLIAFQNCGQPGELALTRNPSTDNVLATPNPTPGPTPVPTPDPIALIVNPTLTINNGAPFTNSKNVTLQISAVGAERMQISKEADCGKEDENWESYAQNKSYVLTDGNNSNSVYARFQKTGAPNTACIKASIVHDDVAPTLAVTKNADAVTSAANVQVGFMAQDAGSGISAVYCKRGTNAEAICNNTFDFAGLAEGAHGVVIRAIDKAGNESSPASVNFIVDRTAPVITINGPTGIIGATKVAYQITVVEANGLKSVECRLSPKEANYKDCSTLKAEYDALTSGAYTFEVKVVDKAGNAASKSQTVTIDASMPTVTITKSPAAIGNVKNVGFEFTGMSGTKPITKFKCAIDNAVLSTCTSPIAYSNLTDKSYTFSVMGTNDVNVDSAVQKYTFVVDTVAPTVKIVSAPSGTTKDKNVVIILDATDINGIKSIECTLDGVVSNCSSKTATYTLPDGTHTFTARATDNAGNTATTAPITFRVDTTPDSAIIANMATNPVKEGTTGTMNVSLTLVTGAYYSCKTVAGNVEVVKGAITGTSASVNFTVSEDIKCTVAGKDKNNADISKIVLAEVGCGNRVKDGNRCTDFKCLKMVELPYSKKFTVPKRTTEGLCYAMKLFDPIANSGSSLNKELDSTVVSRDHDRSGMNLRNPYVLDRDLLNFILEGKRIAKLSGGANITSSIKVDNFVLVGLYPDAIQPVTAHYTAQGTLDSTVTSAQTHILLNNQPVPLKSFGPMGTATVAPIEIISEADENLGYMLDLRALDCGGARELSNIYLIFQ